MLRVSKLACLAAIAAAAACGDNDEIVPDHVDAAPPDVDAAGPPMPTALFVGGDFNVTGVLSRIDVVPRTVQANVLAMVAGGEPWIRRAGDELLIVNRAMGENVTVLSRRPLQLVDQFGTGGGSNPQDVAAVGGKLYVPALGTAGVVVIDRANRETTTISLASLDPDGKPDCVSAHAVGTRLFVACALLDGTFSPRGNGKVAVIDTATDTVVTSFDLPDRNPVGLFVATPATSMFGGDLLIPLVPSFNSFTTGCLARVRTSGTPAANGCAVTNATLEGYVNRVDVAPDGDRAWLVVGAYAPDFSSETGTLRPLDLATGELGAAVTASTSIAVDVAACPGGHVVVSDKATGASGVRLYKDGAEQTTAPLDVGRPPAAPYGLTCY
ncbi:MAG TPA: hypothetical protein VM734_11655 [Kofleriaceae bacterium]|nr:hypothetical protein [Kofleriaceae bacterium]